MPKIGIELRKRYIVDVSIETMNPETLAILKALGVCRDEALSLLQDPKRSIDEYFELIVIASEIVESEGLFNSRGEPAQTLKIEKSDEKLSFIRRRNSA